MKPSMHREELLCLDIIDLYLLFWPAYYISGLLMTDRAYVFMVLPIQLTLQDLPYPV